ncbi:DUF2878 domain-containing protein [Geopsychrobacter electrodiphilus]|uniref:DUF2878 domain-containing protein n=1 Tax=Geopsychrobacter electrodiphilus TaxID=225196 RepID=UPI0003704CA4|nr:DUF2878 domain-containing protein [Geopsychrobacter electrodiphilus]
MKSKLLNILLYQLGWFCCVLGAAWDYPLSGALAALLLLLVHLLLTDSRSAELKLILITCLLGILVDSLQQRFGVLTFRTDPNWGLWLPLWVFVIWAQFASLLRFSLNWLSGRYLLGASLGLLGGPLAYLGGVRIGAAEFGGNLIFSLSSLALVWGVMIPLLFWLRTRIAAPEGQYRGLGTLCKTGELPLCEKE